MKKREKRNKRKIREVHYFYNQQLNLPGLDYGCDSLYGTPSKYSFKDYSEWFSSASRVKKANLLWDTLNSTSGKKPILKKHRSDNTSQKKKEDRVRFQGYARNDSDFEDEVVPQRLDFSKLDYDDSLYDNKHKYGQPELRAGYRNPNSRLMDKIENSIERKKGSFWNIFGGRDDKEDYRYKDQIRVARDHYYDSNIKVVDLRNVGKWEDSRLGYSLSSAKYMNTREKERVGDYDLIEEYSELPTKSKHDLF